MNTAPVVATRLEFDAEGRPRSPLSDDLCHPLVGATAQARKLFMAGNGLPERWLGRPQFVILEIGFGLGSNFLATWAAHRRRADRDGRLHYISIEAHPLEAATLAALPRDEGLGALARDLAAAWPPLTCNLHRLSFDGGAVELLLAFGDVAAWLPQIEAQVDAFYLDGFAPARNPAMSEPRVLRALGRLAAPGATLATSTAARNVREGLRSAGFEVLDDARTSDRQDITLARFAPRHAPRLPARRQRRGACDDGRIVVIGAGLAGCATVAALAAQGRFCTLIERGDAVASAASGNAAGIFHGVVHAADGRHARFNRAAALEVRHAVEQAIADHGVAGGRAGLLRIAPGSDLAELSALAARLGLPCDYVQPVSALQASAIAGCRIDAPAWFYPGGGWVDPRGLARAYLARAAASATLRLRTEVAALRRDGARWSLVDGCGHVVDEADTVVLANAGDAFGMLAVDDPPVRRVRGQVSGMAASAMPSTAWPSLPLAGSGYVLPPVEGTVWFGATTQAGDDDPTVRERDHGENLARLAACLGLESAPHPDVMGGRTGWRWVSDDRLPWVGAVPLAWVPGRAHRGGTPLGGRLDQPRFVERAEGLYLFTALGSRGIAWSALGAQVLAAAITGAPCPLEADLIDAIDPARFVSRAWRRASATRSSTDTQPPLGPAAGAPAEVL